MRFKDENMMHFTSSENILYLLMRWNPSYDDQSLLACLAFLEDDLEAPLSALDDMVKQGEKSSNYLECIKAI